jgi:hypothetical protein
MPVTDIPSHLVDKNRDRDAPDFANINLLGKCNARCYFCLGREIEGIDGRRDTTVPFVFWPNFVDEFLPMCKAAGIKKLYVTGQNTDALLYHNSDEGVQLQLLHGRNGQRRIFHRRGLQQANFRSQQGGMSERCRGG